jgi:gamma-glutamylcysteine synthetase
VLYDAEARRAAWALTCDWSLDERFEAWRNTPRAGLHGRVAGRPMLEHCRELVRIARAGLGRLGASEELPLLAPLEAIVSDGRTVADRIAAEWERHHGAPAAIIDSLRLR